MMSKAPGRLFETLPRFEDGDPVLPKGFVLCLDGQRLDRLTVEFAEFAAA